MKKTNEYIERDAAIITINKYRIGLRKHGLVILDGAVAEVRKRIDSLPAADVRPVARGEWEVWNDDKNTFECSRCGMAFTLYEGTPKDNDYNYCPNCGADMRGEKDG